MVRPLTSPTAAQAVATSATPVNILKIEFGGSVGTKYFSDRALGNGSGSSALNAQCRVVSWGNINQIYREDAFNPVGDSQVTLLDGDLTLKGYFDDIEFQRRPVTLYQHFSGLLENDLQIVLKGIINAPVRWSEDKATVTFDITDISTLYRKDIGTILKKEDFPYIAREDEGKTIPIVFGRVRRSPMVCLQGGVITELARKCGAADMTLFVADAERFPQGVDIKVRIEGEIISGRFLGNTLVGATRGAALADSTITGSRDSTSFYDRTLGDTDGQYLGYFLYVLDPNGESHYREITAYSGSQHCVKYYPDIKYSSGGSIVTWTIPVGWAYKITSWARSHDQGAKVYLAEAGGEVVNYVFLANDAASLLVRYVEGKGTWTRLIQTDTEDSSGSQEITIGRQVQGWKRIDPAQYVVNRNDASVFGADHRVTTLTFTRHPAEINRTLDQVAVTIDGVESDGDGTGLILQKPGEVIQEVLTRFAGVPLGTIDTASFDDADDDGGKYLRFAFTLTEVKDSLQLVADLAFQARCALLWEDGEARLQFLRNKLVGNSLTLNTGNIREDSLQVRRRSFEDAISEVEGAFYDQGERESIVARDAAVEAAYGRRVKSISLWAYSKRDHARAVVNFWLERFKFLWTTVEMETFLPALKIQRRDVVTLNWPAFFMSGQKARVMEVNHRPGMGESQQMDTIGLGLELPIKAGCAAVCETDCETGAETGCFTQCENQAESCWQCETHCEEACELACTTAAEQECVTNDTGCGNAACETACQAWCESSCESSCELDCQSTCELACQTACEVSCETGCELICETGCEVACQTGCEVVCETGGCETSCETGCQTTCETGGCETACQTGCEVVCETGGCETACQTGCEVTCETSCQTGCETSCQVECEIWCETGCQTSCESGECETSCEIVCETGGCETSCEAGECETGCQTTCQVACQTDGCQTGVCETSCEVGECETGCQVTCQTGGCETACETSCEVICETACETTCETACETACETGAEVCFTSASDDFDREDEYPLAGNWTQEQTHGTDPINLINDQIWMNNGSSALSMVHGHWNLQPACWPNQRVMISISWTPQTQEYAGGCVIARRTSNTFYRAYLYTYGGSACVVLDKFVAGAWTRLDTSWAPGYGTLVLECEGSNIRVWACGVKFIDVTDSDIPTGSGTGMGLSVQGASPVAVQGDNWYSDNWETWE